MSQKEFIYCIAWKIFPGVKRSPISKCFQVWVLDRGYDTAWLGVKAATINSSEKWEMKQSCHHVTKGIHILHRTKNILSGTSITFCNELWIWIQRTKNKQPNEPSGTGAQNTHNIHKHKTPSYIDNRLSLVTDTTWPWLPPPPRRKAASSFRRSPTGSALYSLQHERRCRRWLSTSTGIMIHHAIAQCRRLCHCCRRHLELLSFLPILVIGRFIINVSNNKYGNMLEQRGRVSLQRTRGKWSWQLINIY